MSAVLEAVYRTSHCVTSLSNGQIYCIYVTQLDDSGHVVLTHRDFICLYMDINDFVHS